MVKFLEIKQKEVINIDDGCRLGYVCDIEIDEKNGKVEAIIIPGPGRMLGVFGHDQEYRIEWCDIKQIGEDLIIVDVDAEDVLDDCS